MKKRMYYLWERHVAPKLIELFDGREDLENKPEIPQVSVFGKIHQKYIDKKRKPWAKP